MKIDTRLFREVAGRILQASPSRLKLVKYAGMRAKQGYNDRRAGETDRNLSALALEAGKDFETFLAEYQELKGIVSALKAKNLKRTFQHERRVYFQGYKK